MSFLHVVSWPRSAFSSHLVKPHTPFLWIMTSWSDDVIWKAACFLFTDSAFYIQAPIERIFVHWDTSKAVLIATNRDALFSNSERELCCQRKNTGNRGEAGGGDGGPAGQASRGTCAQPPGQEVLWVSPQCLVHKDYDNFWHLIQGNSRFQLLPHPSPHHKQWGRKIVRTLISQMRKMEV